MRHFLRLLFLLLVTQVAMAGGRGGHVTNFDPNLFGGNWTTINCTNTSGDDTALNSWRTAAIAANPALAKLRLTGTCSFSAGFICTPNSCSGSTQGVLNAIVWAYGATIRANDFRIGSTAFFSDATHGAFIQTAALNATTVTLVTPSDASIFSVGDWVYVTALELQTDGFPPNFQFFQSNLITAINGVSGAITLGIPLNSQYYRSTYPSFNGNGVGPNGPAKLFKLEATWNTNLTIYGGTVTPLPGKVGNQESIVGRTIVVNDMVFTGENTSPGSNQQAWMFYSHWGGMEHDKEQEFFGSNRSWSRANMTFQSPSPIHAVIDNSTIGGSINGSPVNLTVRNSTILPGSLLRIGPTGIFGNGASVSLDGLSFPNGFMTENEFLIANTSFSSGVLSVSKSLGFTSAQAVAWGTPAGRYLITSGGDVSNSASSPLSYFDIVDVAEDASNYLYTMGNCSWGACSGSLPSPVCSGGPCDSYTAYPAPTSIIQRFSSPGDITRFRGP